MDFDGIARQAMEKVAAGEQADAAAVQKLARKLNISPEPSRPGHLARAHGVPYGPRGQDPEARRDLG